MKVWYEVERYSIDNGHIHQCQKVESIDEAKKLLPYVYVSATSSKRIVKVTETREVVE